MPKIYGRVTLNGNILTCKDCGRSWKPNEDELNEIKLGHKVSCLYCRAMNELRVGQVIPRNHRYRLCSTVDIKDIDELRGDNYQQKKVKVIHDRCRRTFEVSLIDLRTGDIECEYCKKAERNEIKELEAQDKRKDTTKLTETVIKADDVCSNSIKLDLRKSLKDMVGKVFNSSVKLVSLDLDKHTYTTQCIKCGMEQERDLNELKKNKAKGLVCDKCIKEDVNLADLKRRYLGNVYNGLRVEKIYLNNYGATVCDVICIQGKKNINLREYINLIYNKGQGLTNISYKELDNLHIQTGLALGDVINKRIYCPICGDEKLLNIPKYRQYLVCNNIDEYRKLGIDVKLGINSLNAKEFYKNPNRSLCYYCNIREKCKHESDARNSFSVISSLIDIQDNLVYSLLNIQSEYPRILNISKKGSNIDIIPEKEIIVLNACYTGRDNKIYRNCKCMKHGTELILNDDEIHNFEHEQCGNPYMRFFDITNTQLK